MTDDVQLLHYLALMDDGWIKHFYCYLVPLFVQVTLFLYILGNYCCVAEPNTTNDLFMDNWYKGHFVSSTFLLQNAIY